MPNSHRSRSHAGALAVALALTPLAALAAAPATLDPSSQWPAWRGPLATGVAPHGDPPVSWSEERNVRWKVALPGLGHSCPVIWGERIFLTAAIPFGDPAASPAAHADGAHDNVDSVYQQRFVVLAVDRRDGAIVWQRTVRSERPHAATHESGSWASGSVVTDGERVYAFFGSSGLYALTLDGEPVWERDFGRMQTLHAHGEGASPALHGDTLVINWDHEGESFITALDARSGKERWRVARDEVTSWSTPLIVDVSGKPQIVTAATQSVRAYDLASGALVWELAGLSRNVVASPVAAGGLVVVGSSYDTRAMFAVRLAGAKGDISGTEAVAWSRDRDTPYVPSPLLYDGRLYFLKHLSPLLTAVVASTGEPVYGPLRLDGLSMTYASPVAAAGRIYVTSRDGATAVIAAGPEPRILALNQLDDTFAASAAVVGRELYLRGARSLYRIEDAAAAPATPATPPSAPTADRAPGPAGR